jgi:hypothetical protein
VGEDRTRVRKFFRVAGITSVETVKIIVLGATGLVGRAVVAALDPRHEASRRSKTCVASCSARLPSPGGRTVVPR